MNRYYVKTAAIIDATGTPPLENGMMLIENGRITAIDVHLASDGAPVLDLSEYHILPGLVDSHTHLSIIPGLGNQTGQHKRPAGEQILSSIQNMRKMLEGGVTTARVMGEEHFIDVDIKNAINKGIIEGPRLFISAVKCTSSDGHLIGLTTADGELEIRKMLRHNFYLGADFAKIFLTGGMSSARPKVNSCTYTREEIATAVDEARRMDTYVAAHAHGGPGVDLCIEEGVLSIEHGALLSREQVDRIREKEMWIVGTFSISFHPNGIEQSDFANPLIKEKVLEGREITKRTYSYIVKSGVNYALGTDSMHGLFSFDMECLVNFGASEMDAIKAATRSGAVLCRMEKDIGTLEKGKFADFIAVRGNPLKDIKAMRNVELVFKGGKNLVDKRLSTFAGAKPI